MAEKLHSPALQKLLAAGRTREAEIRRTLDEAIMRARRSMDAARHDEAMDDTSTRKRTLGDADDTHEAPADTTLNTSGNTSKKGARGKKSKKGKSHDARSSSPHNVNTACGAAGQRANVPAPGKHGSTSTRSGDDARRSGTASATTAQPRQVAEHTRGQEKAAMAAMAASDDSGFPELAKEAARGDVEPPSTARTPGESEGVRDAPAKGVFAHSH